VKNPARAAIFLLKKKKGYFELKEKPPTVTIGMNDDDPDGVPQRGDYLLKIQKNPDRRTLERP
jgi:hypothetical protein